MAQIRHIGISTDNAKALAEFWRDVFGFTIDGLDDRGNAWVTDGHLNIALLHRQDPGSPLGINHWGVTLDGSEKEEVYAKMAERDLRPTPSPPLIVDGREVPRPYAEDKAKDIDGNRFDLSTMAQFDMSNKKLID